MMVLRWFLFVLADLAFLVLAYALAPFLPVFAIGMGLEIYAVVTGKPLDSRSYALGDGAPLVSIGVGKKFGS